MMADITKRAQVAEFFQFETLPFPIAQLHPHLAAAAHSVAKLGLLPDAVDHISVQQIAFCWKLVEVIKLNGFPDSLKV